MSTTDHFYTISAGERDAATNQYGYHWENIACYVFATQASASVPLFRLYNGGNGDHFYCINVSERDAAASGGEYVMEGVACYVFPQQRPGTVPLFRIANPENGDHFYVTSEAERDQALTYGYKAEGVACYVFPQQSSGTVPLFRMFNGQAPIQEATDYEIFWISYDTSHGTIQENIVDSVYSEKIQNHTKVPESSELSGSQTVTETTGWSNRDFCKGWSQGAGKCSLCGWR